ncbi:ABC transporter ATP-binding protein [Albimonas pacifica]|uniref:Peptide/nickel transport system ATP-binding protein n=1 Tax=Albimonas pacifica TaxID=1114924 RepID=A0A1I3HRW8_9RHOB|nr:ABC transporter ATP-binding protein [Albimonas pacifica]SFI38504.1 peptide/nickel transport system ATP-binding protein [Albimonas pacifica]
MTLLSVRDLTVRFATDEGLVTAVDQVSFDLEPGEVMGLVGESGSGKSVTAKSIMQLNFGGIRYGETSQILLDVDGRQTDALKLKRPRDLRLVRGGAVSMIFQEPMASFAPAITIGDQMVEQLILHKRVSKAEAKKTSIEFLDRAGISDAARRFDQYAFELSGGMRQRAMIAMALSTRPRLLIADEPTTALDVTIQAQVIDLMKEIVAEFGMAIIFITHDLGVIAQTADKVAVMYLGKMVEQGPVREVIRTAAHPYTQGLLNALPDLSDLDSPLKPVPGDIPSPLERPAGCVFHTRCPEKIPGRCDAAVPAMAPVAPGHACACFARETEGAA